MAAATPMGCAATPSRSARAWSRSPTSTMRWCPTACIVSGSAPERPSSTCGRRPAVSSMPASRACSSSSSRAISTRTPSAMAPREGTPMVLLETRFEPRPAGRRPEVAGAARQVVLAAITLVVVGSVGGVVRAELAPLGHALASAGVHSGFVGLGWVIALQGRPGWQGPAVRFTTALVLASVASRLHTAAAVLYLLPLAVLLHDA